jgi:predicted KAP-like P-loop ATPase
MEGQTESPHATYFSDQPIQSKEEDEFNRWPFAKRIADTLATRTDPRSLVIGLYGPWGDGKTSTLRLMRKSLSDHPNVVAIEFNPWLFGSDEQLLRGFFETVATSIGQSLSTNKEQIGKTLKDYGSLLSLTVPGLGGVAEGLGKALSTAELDQLRTRLEGLLREAGKRIVVLIDDIDRLDQREIHSIFKLVKLSANFEYTSYTLAFDDQIVAAALGKSYGGGDIAAGRSFLEKIVQVPLRLPPPDELALRRMTFAGVEVSWPPKMRQLAKVEPCP